MAIVALAIFAVEPVTIRYGRAFQPDALMLGCVVVGMRLMDDGTRGARCGRMGFAGGRTGVEDYVRLCAVANRVGDSIREASETDLS